MPGSILSALCGVTFLLQLPSEVGSSFMWEDTETFPRGHRESRRQSWIQIQGLTPLHFAASWSHSVWKRIVPVEQRILKIAHQKWSKYGGNQ